MLEILYILIAFVIAVSIGVPFVIYHDKYKKLLRELEKDNKDGDE